MLNFVRLRFLMVRFWNLPSRSITFCWWGTPVRPSLPSTARKSWVYAWRLAGSGSCCCLTIWTRFGIRPCSTRRPFTGWSPCWLFSWSGTFRIRIMRAWLNIFKRKNSSITVMIIPSIWGRIPRWPRISSSSSICKTFSPMRNHELTFLFQMYCVQIYF